MTAVPKPNETDALRDEVAHIADREGLDIRMVMAMAGDRTLNAREEKILQQIQEVQGEELFANMLYTLTGRAFPSRQAKHLWQEILAHRSQLKNQLNRDVGISVAAHDYLANVVRLLRNICLIEESKLTQLASVATRDGLTGLLDQATFKHQLNEELERVKRYGGLISLMMLDLDHFKKINDSQGHAEGDRVLQQVALVLQQHLRSLDIPARYGGEEFAIILPETDLKTAEMIGERLREKVHQHFAGEPYRVTISIGIAAAEEDKITTGEDLIKKADEALYTAKKGGRNKVCIAT